MHATRYDQFNNKYEIDSYAPSNDSNEPDDMPNRLYWRPICENDDPIDNQLKYILMEQDLLLNNLLTTKELEFLRGVRSSAEFFKQNELANSVKKIIDAIECFGMIQLYSKVD